jgi:lipopolysaccharide transport system permease protein
MKEYLEFLYEMTIRDLKIKYNGSKAGFFLMITNPIIQVAIIGLVFSYFIKIQNYYIFLMSGLIPWQYFSQTISSSTQSLVNERRLIHKSKFNLEIIPLSISLSNFIILIPSLVILTLYQLLTGFISMTHVMMMIPTVLLMLLLTSSLSIILSVLGVYFRSLTHVINPLLLLFFYSTPIVYKLDMLPENLKKISSISPVSGYTQLFHYSLLNIKPSYPGIILVGFAMIVLLVFISIRTIKSKGSFIIDKL